jgi:hypothetical protein
METHLFSSFLINIGQAAGDVLEMLKHARSLVERRESRNGRRKPHWPRISYKKWLTSGGEQDSSMLPENARREARTGRGSIDDSSDGDDESGRASTEALLRPKYDEETGAAEFNERILPHNGNGRPCRDPEKPQASIVLWLRGIIDDTVDSFMHSEQLAFALKLTVAALLVTWPAFVPYLNAWYVSIRGTCATLQLILVFKVSIGTSFLVFFFRALGTTFGCSNGIIAWEIGQGNRIVLVIVLAIGLLPASYIQLATPYVKAGVISMVSLSIVGIGT